MNLIALRRSRATTTLAVLGALFAVSFAITAGQATEALSFGASVPDLASTLGLSFRTAEKIIDKLLAAWSIWSVIGIIGTIAGSGGIGIGILAVAKWAAKKYGKKYAAAW